MSLAIKKSTAPAIAPLPAEPDCLSCPTRNVCTARDLPVDTLGALSDCIATTVPLQRNDHLYRMGERADRCYVVRSGVFKTQTISASGEEYVTGFYYPGELLGLGSQTEGVFVNSAIALASSTACRLRIDDFSTLFALGAGTSLLRLIAERENMDMRLQINLRQSKADMRIAGFLQLLSERLGLLGFSATSLPLPMSRTDLANHLGLTLECVSRVLGKWKRSGLIATQRDHLFIRQPGELTTLAYHLAL